MMLTSVAAADGRDDRGRERGESRREERRSPERGGDRGRASQAPPYRGSPYGGYAPPPYAVYPSEPVYAAPPPGAYVYTPPPGYAPNSLGADWGQQQDQARNGVRQGRLMPLGQVMDLIKRGTPGRLLDAGLEPGPDGRPAYRVRWAATGGRRIDFIVDAVSGAILARTGY
jgi:hypothetical protein